MGVADAAFIQRDLRLHGEGLWWASTGADVPEAERHRINGELRACVARGVGRAAHIRVMSEAIRRIAALDASVGTSLLAICIPRREPERYEQGAPQTIWMGNKFREGEVTSLYIPTGSDDGTQYGPHLACPGAISVGLRGGKLPPGTQRVQAPRLAHRWGPILLVEYVRVRSRGRWTDRPILEGIPFSVLGHSGRAPGTMQPLPCLISIQGPGLIPDNWNSRQLGVFPVVDAEQEIAGFANHGGATHGNPRVNAVSKR